MPSARWPPPPAVVPYEFCPTVYRRRSAVRADGLVLTKASELEGKLECIFPDGSRSPAVKVAQRDECDWRCSRVREKNLLEVHWSDSPLPPVGSWLITTNLEPLPVAIGVVSAPVQESPMPRAVLGVKMYRVDRGVRVNVVMPGTGAARAGVRQGDVIATINGRLADSPETISDVIRGLQPGDKVTLSVLREQEPISLVATLGDMTRRGGLDQTELMDSLGGPLSRRRAGFPSVIQHDSVINDCGDPIVGLDGKAVGVNIARASRVSTLALPADIARSVVQDMLGDISNPKAGGEPTTTISTAKTSSSTP